MLEQQDLAGFFLDLVENAIARLKVLDVILREKYLHFSDFNPVDGIKLFNSNIDYVENANNLYAYPEEYYECRNDMNIICEHMWLNN